MIERIGVFAGAREGTHDVYQHATRALGCELARRGLELVYGGDQSGLARLLAESTLAAGGSVMGIVSIEQRPVDDDGLDWSTLFPATSPGEQTQDIVAFSDAMIFLPGGYGTLSALTEVLSLAERGLLHKPIGLLDAGSFFAPWLRLQRRLVLTRQAKKTPCLLMAATASRLLDEVLWHSLASPQ